jgi:DivIVA domain-containing protein
MPLDRPSIERTDFPLGRRGYDPAAVDAHLKSVADQVEELVRESARRAAPLASSASDQVRGIVDAAEASAAAIEQKAQSDARAYLEPVRESTTEMLDRLDAMKAELGALYESLRAGAEALLAQLRQLDSQVSTAHEAVTGASSGEHISEPAKAGTGGRDGDAEGARLVALNMALGGASREETEGYLAEHLGPQEARVLLEEIYAMVER